MKSKYNMLFAAVLVSGANAADIDLFGARNNPLPTTPADQPAAYTATNWVKPSFASTNSAVDGGLGTNIYVVHDDANLDGDNDPKTVTWFSTNNYFLRDRLFIPNGVTLTIQPGTKIYGGTNDNGTAVRTDDAIGSLVATRGGKLIADGTAAAPIVFTSVREWEAATGNESDIDQDAAVGPAPTAANAGLWGGVVLLGQAYCSFVNASGVNAGTVQIEGFAPTGSQASADGIPDATQYGTSVGFPRKDDDNSGIVRYVSIRHGGYEFSSGREINGLTMGAVGSATTIEFVEVYANLDDGFEWFGGRNSANNLVVAFVQDDMFDMDEGFRANLQFLLGVQNPGDADGGGELDGVGNSSAGHAVISSFGTLHHAKPLVYNATIIGAGADNTKHQITAGRGPTGTKHVNWEKGNVAFIMEDYHNGEYYNSVYTDFAMGVIRYADTLSASVLANIGNNVVIENCTFGNFGAWPGVTPASDRDLIFGNSGVGYDLVYNSIGTPINGNTPTGTNPMFTAYSRDSINVLTALNPVPAPGSPLLTAPVSGGAPKKVSYRGAFGPGGNWAAGWTRLSETGVLTGAAPAPAIVDTDGDGASDALETANAALGLNPAVSDAGTVLPTLTTPAQFAANFTAGQTSVTSNPSAFSLYTASSIQDLRGTGMMIGPVTPGGNATLTLPLFSSPDLTTWTAAGNATATVATPPGKQFFRVNLSTNAPNP